MACFTHGACGSASTTGDDRLIIGAADGERDRLLNGATFAIADGDRKRVVAAVPGLQRLNESGCLVQAVGVAAVGGKIEAAIGAGNAGVRLLAQSRHHGVVCIQESQCCSATILVKFDPEVVPVSLG